MYNGNRNNHFRFNATSAGLINYSPSRAVRFYRNVSTAMAYKYVWLRCNGYSLISPVPTLAERLPSHNHNLRAYL